ncbi:hypothetical protein Aperf_G00000107496 [Anoplocephala perfoliata]
MFTAESYLPFSLKVYMAVKGYRDDSNYFVSPLSIYSALSMALCGSANASYNELLSVLQFHTKKGDDFDKTLAVLGKNLNDILDDENDKTLVLANGIFLDANFEVLKSFSNSLERHFQADPHQVNFASASEEARNQINKWVSDRTAEKIKDLMPKGSVDSQTRLVLANAIYFKGTWKDVFDSAMTSEGPFYTLNGGSINVPMMRATKSYFSARFKELKATALKIPFKIHEMLIVLPDQKNGLPDLLRALAKSETLFKSLFDQSHYHSDSYELSMPKFKLGGGGDSTIDLKKPLSEMGLESVFTRGRADFSRITKKESLFISNIFHQAVIEVNEEGAEAAAATGISIVDESLPPSFNVDHPFLFFIVTSSGVPAFMGNVVNPLTD